MFHIQRAVVFAATDHDKVFKEAKRHVMGEGVANHIGQENAVALCLGDNHPVQVFKDRTCPMDHPQVEPDGTQHQGLWLRLFDPFVEILLPDTDRLTPFVGFCHHLAGAIDVADGIKAITDKIGQ